MAGVYAHGTAASGTLALNPPPPYISMLTIEDGTIVANADTLIDIGFVTAYALKTGQSSTWSGLATDTLREQAIFRAMQKLIYWEERYLGLRTSSLQTLPFPRYGMFVNGYEVASDTIPLAVKQAQAELAIREAETMRSTMPDETATTGRIMEEDKQVGKLRKRVVYGDGKNMGKQPFYPAVKALLDPYMRPLGVLMQY